MLANKEQTQAINHQGALLVLAPPGSGKTFVCTHRAANILANQANSRVLCLTFTNKAAAELRDRILAITNVSRDRLQVQTFHSEAKAHLQEQGKLGKDLSGKANRPILHACWKQYCSSVNFAEFERQIALIKTTLNPRIEDAEVKAAYDAYEEALCAQGAMDMSDWLLYCVQYIKKGDIPPLPFTHIIVDEGQDTDEIQKALILLHGQLAEVTIVGDDDQSIYRFRNSLGFDGMREMQRKLNAYEIILKENYRSHVEILNAASALIANNSQRFAKKLHSAKGEGGLVATKSFITRTEETEAIVSIVQENPEEWAVLTRTNTHLDIIELALSTAGVPYTRTGSESLWQREHVVKYLQLLRAIAQNDEHLFASSLYWIGLPQTDVITLARDYEGRLLKIIGKKEPLNGLSAQGCKKIAEISPFIETWRNLAQQKKDALSQSLLVCGVADYVKGFCQSQYQENDLNIAGKAITKKAGTIPGRIAAILFAQKQPDREKATPGVQLLTLHASKGLEFPKVWMPGCEEGNLPHKDSSSDTEGVSEERRLCYVGMTRAKDRLIASYSTRVPMARNQDKETFPSSFLLESGLLNPDHSPNLKVSNA